MKFKDFYFGKRELLNIPDIIKAVQKSINYNKDNDEKLDNANAILLYEKPDRRSWIVKTNKRVYKILDDKTKGRPIINWSEEAQKFNKMVNNVVVKYRKEALGLLEFPNKPNKKYYFDPNLHQGKDIKNFLAGKE